MMGSARKRPDRFDDITELHRHLVDGKPVQRETSDRRCDEEIETVNKMLQASGFQTKIIPLAKSKSPQESFESSITTLRRVLTTLKSSDRTTEESTEKLRRVVLERDSAKENLNRVNRRIENREKQIEDLERRASDASSRQETSIDEMKREAAELKIIKSNLVQKEEQILCDVKRMAEEHEKLKERLRTISSTREKRPKPSILMERTLVPTRQASTEAEFLSDTINSLKLREETLSNENEEIRLNLQRYDDNINDIIIEEGDEPNLEVPCLLEIPSSNIQAEIGNCLVSKLTALRERTARAYQDEPRLSPQTF